MFMTSLAQTAGRKTTSNHGRICETFESRLFIKQVEKSSGKLQCVYYKQNSFLSMESVMALHFGFPLNCLSGDVSEWDASFWIIVE